MIPSIQETEEELIEEFSMFTDWTDKYEYLIDLAKELPSIDEDYRKDENLIKGCQSRVWLQAELHQGRVQFKADSDAVITKGIIALMVRVLNNHTPDEILHAELSFIDKIGLKEHLSPTRSNGLVSMVAQMKRYAVAFKAKQINN